MNSTLTAYPFALLYGLYFYVLFQLIFIARFGQINTNFSALDVCIWLIGVASVIGLMYFMRLLPGCPRLMWIPFLLAVPIAFIGALLGGLGGIVGVLLGGLVPFGVILSLGYAIIVRATRQSGESVVSVN